MPTLQDSANVLYGPYNLTMTGGTGFIHNALLPDSFAWNFERKRGNTPIGDGREKNYDIGCKLTVEITFEEVLTADMALIRACTALACAFTNPSKTFTIGVAVADSTFMDIFVDVVDGNTKITIIKTGIIGIVESSMFTIT